eukprot:jgi/Mesen1/389/ME000010S_10857
MCHTQARQASRSAPRQLPLGGARGFAVKASPPGHMQRMNAVKIYVQSPGVIGEPYKPSPPPLPFLQRWFTRAGWKRRRASVFDYLKTAYTVAKLRKHSKGFTQKQFYRDAADLYSQVNKALAGGDRTALRQLVTESVFSQMKKEMKVREDAGWTRVRWEVQDPIKSIRTAQGRLIALSKDNADNAFVQLTLVIQSHQKYAAYNKQGKVVAGDPNSQASDRPLADSVHALAVRILVEDIWVLERHLLHPEQRWRLCGRISV